MKILIVDDEEDDRVYLKTLLEKAGHKVTLATNGRLANDIFVSQPSIGLVITDFRMPNMSGLDLLANIRTVRLDARIWLVSSHMQQSVIDQAVALGAEKAIQKMEMTRELVKAGIIPER